jgi:transcriptional antiterminator RfaH
MPRISRKVELPADDVAAIEVRANAMPRRRVPSRDSREVSLDDDASVAWFVVYTNINCETRALKGLAAAGYRTFLPVLRKFVRHARQRHAVDRPLFTRYLFIGLDPARDGWFAVRTTHGVESILGHEGMPQAVPAEVIAQLRTAQASGRFDFTRPRATFKPGDLVAVDGGPFGDFVAEVATAEDGKRVEILHNLFGRLTRMRIDVSRVHTGASDDASRG